MKTVKKEIHPFDHSKTVCDFLDAPCAGSVEIPAIVTPTMLYQIKEDISLWEDIIADELERGDYEMAALDRKSLQTAKLQKVAMKNTLKMMMRKEKMEKELICA